MIVKICGITNLEDALAAEAAGADMLGFVFAESPRRIGPEVAGIIRGLGDRVKKVGVFVDGDIEEVIRKRGELGLDLVQLHGNESAEYCRRLMPGVIKLMRVSEGFAPAALEEFPADYYLLEGERRGAPGGTGEGFDWEKAGALRGDGRVIVSGGLDPGNVATAIARLAPGGVDVSSGVEREPGIKDHRKLKEFIKAARELSG